MAPVFTALACAVGQGCGGAVGSSATKAPSLDAGAPDLVDGGATPDLTDALDSTDTLASMDAVGSMKSTTSADAVADAPSCTTTSMSSLPGVTIAFRSPVTCTFSVAKARAGIAIGYDVVVAADVDGVVPAPQDIGGCGGPGPSQLMVFEELKGGSQTYCQCDVGLCPGTPRAAVTLAAGTYPSEFQWSGSNWAGPSDTNSPMGAPFPPGGYTLTVSAEGKQNGSSFVVAATLAITLTP